MTAIAEIITGSPWKAARFVSAMNQRGILASVAEMSVYAEEPDHRCPRKLSGKLTSASTIVSKPNPNNQTSFTVSKENSFGIPNFQIPGVQKIHLIR